MMRGATIEIAQTRAAKHNLVKNVWRAQVNPKLKESVQEEPIRMGLQAIAWVIMMGFFLAVFIYSYLYQRCEPLKTLLSAEDAGYDSDGYTCEAIEVPQVFHGQPYYDNAFYWGFGVVSAWGTFNGSSWTDFCGDLMTTVKELADFNYEDVTIGDLEVELSWTHSFNTLGGTSEDCNYSTIYLNGLNILPNAPGGIFGCSYPGNSSVCRIDGEENGEKVEDTSAIVGLYSSTLTIDSESPFCPDFIVWHPFTALYSPLDIGDDYISDLCDVWGQDVGIVSKAVQSCEKEVCRTWYNVLGSAFALTLAIEVAVVLLIVMSFKVSEHLEEKKRQEEQSSSSRDGGGGEEKDGDEDEEEAIKGMVERGQFAKETGQTVYDAGMMIKSALA